MLVRFLPVVLLSLPAVAAPPKGPGVAQVVTNAVSNLCLGVRGVDSHVNGGQVEVYYCNPGNGDLGVDNQWGFVPGLDGHVRLMNRSSGLCLGVIGDDSHGDGTLVEVWKCGVGEDDQWLVVQEDDGFKRLQNRVSGLCLSVSGVDDHAPGADVHMHTCDVADDPARDHRWRFQGL